MFRCSLCDFVTVNKVWVGRTAVYLRVLCRLACGLVHLLASMFVGQGMWVTVMLHAADMAYSVRGGNRDELSSPSRCVAVTDCNILEC